MQLRYPVDAGKHVDVPRDERTLRDDAHLESGMLGENLENSSRDSELPLAGLIRIGCGSNDDRLAFEKSEMPFAAVAKRARDDFRRVLLHEDVALECEPRWHLIVSLME